MSTQFAREHSYLLAGIVFVTIYGIAAGFYWVRYLRIMHCNRIGIGYKDCAMWDDAIVWFNRALRLDRRHAMTLYNRGYCLYAGKKFIDGARRDFVAAIAADERCVMALYALGHLCLHQFNAIGHSQRYLRKALQIDAGLAPVHNTLGLVEIRKNHWKAALECFHRAVMLDDGYDAAQCNMSIALLYRGRSADALVHAKKYAVLQPNLSRARNNLAIIYGACGLRRKAIKEFSISHVLDPDTWEVHFWLGCVNLEIGDYANAIAAFQEAIRIRGPFALACYDLALCYEAIGADGLACAYIEKAIELNPHMGEKLFRNNRKTALV
jgi:protein O-GlcNAc transferase